MTMITPSYLGETIEYSSLHACRSTLEDPTSEPVEHKPKPLDAYEDTWRCSCGAVFVVEAGYVICPEARKSAVAYEPLV